MTFAAALAVLRWAIAHLGLTLALILLFGWGIDHVRLQHQIATATTALQRMTQDRDDEKANATRSEAGRQTALASNLSILRTNESLVAANKAAADLAADAKAAGDAALRDLRRARALLAASSARETTLRSQLYGTDPDVARWGAERVPDALAARLRESARATAGP